ncbi:putative reverse transcriptase domain-containing protein [Tanacetum coccineum]
MARELVEQSVQGKAARIGESNKWKWEDNQRNNNNNNHNYNNSHNNNNNNRNRNNNHHQQQNRRPDSVRAYVAAPAGGKIYAGNLPKCNWCGEKGHFKDKCPKVGNQQNDGARGKAYVGKEINVYLRPLIDDLKHLWTLKGVETIDTATCKTFNIRVMRLWTINDFPARSSLFGGGVGEGVIVLEDDHDVIHDNNSYDLALSTSLGDLDFTTLNIDGQSTNVEAPPDIFNVDEDDNFIDDEDGVPHDLVYSDDEVLANDDDDDDDVAIFYSSEKED